jgi:hypothetical protein
MSINEILSIVLKVLCFILIAFIIPYIKKKYSQQQLNEINEKIQTYVEAAEQLFPKDKGAEKKEWVREKLLGLGIDADIDYINSIIESCVLLLHNALKE